VRVFMPHILAYAMTDFNICQLSAIPYFTFSRNSAFGRSLFLAVSSPRTTAR
jgi:hypothetical protein